MYKYVDFYHDICLGYKKNIFILSTKCYEFSFLDNTVIIIFCEIPNCYQYYFLTIHSFFFVIINATIVHILFFERKRKRKITVKNPFTNNCNTMVDPAKKMFQLNQCWIWKHVNQDIISKLFLQ